MGRQIHFHMLGDDCRRFFSGIRQFGTCASTLRDTTSPTVEPIESPCTVRATLVLWNAKLTSSVERRLVRQSVRGSYYRVLGDACSVEFSPTGRPTMWAERPAVTAGRLYASAYRDDTKLAQWYEQIAGWLRRHFRSHRIGGVVAYVGPDAWLWHQQGGVLLPRFRPPVTETWRGLLGLTSSE